MIQPEIILMYTPISRIKTFDSRENIITISESSWMILSGKIEDLFCYCNITQQTIHRQYFGRETILYLNIPQCPRNFGFLLDKKCMLVICHVHKTISKYFTNFRFILIRSITHFHNTAPGSGRFSWSSEKFNILLHALQRKITADYSFESFFIKVIYL